MRDSTKVRLVLGVCVAVALMVFTERSSRVADNSSKSISLSLFQPAEAALVSEVSDTTSKSNASAAEIANLVRIHDCLWHLEWTESRGMPLEARRLAVYSAIARAADNRPDFGGSDECDVVYYKYKGVSQYSGPTHYKLVRTGKEAEESSRIVWEVMLGEWRPEGEQTSVRYYLNRRYSAAKSIAWFDRATKLVVKVNSKDGGHEYRRELLPGERSGKEAEKSLAKAHVKVPRHSKPHTLVKKAEAESATPTKW